MAQDNPFLNLFEGIGAGMEAGQRRRNLMERARQGEISPQEVPGLGMTALMGAVRAATPASTRLAQDQLKLQAANYALQNSIREKEYKLRQQNQILDEAEYNAKLQQSIDDNLGFRTANEEILRMLDAEDIDGIRAFKAPKGMSLSGQQQIDKLKKDALATKQAQRISEYRDIKSQLIADFDYTEENLPRDFFTAKTTLEKLTGMQESEEKLRAAEATQIRAEGLGSDSYTLQTPGGSITVRKVDKEEADNYTRVQLGEEIRAANAAVARAMSDRYTLQTPGGSITVRKVDKEEADNYTRVQLGEEIRAANAAVARAMSDRDNTDPRAVAILEDNLETLVNMAKARGFPEIIPGQLQDSPPPPPSEDTGLGDYDEFLKTQSQYIDLNIKNF